VGTTSSRTTLYVIQVVLRLVVLVAYHSYHVSAMRVVSIGRPLAFRPTSKTREADWLTSQRRSSSSRSAV